MEEGLTLCGKKAEGVIVAISSECTSLGDMISALNVIGISLRPEFVRTTDWRKGEAVR